MYVYVIYLIAASSKTFTSGIYILTCDFYQSLCALLWVESGKSPEQSRQGHANRNALHHLELHINNTVLHH